MTETLFLFSAARTNAETSNTVGTVQGLLDRQNVWIIGGGFYQSDDQLNFRRDGAG